MKKSYFGILTLALLLSSIHCGGDSTTGAQTFSGAVAFESGTSGTLEITVPDAATQGRANARQQTVSLPVITGRCIYPDSSVSLSGSYDSTTGDFTLTGGGFTFTGNLDSTTGAFTGSVEDDSGSAGSFSGVDAANDDVRVFCGTFEQGQESGVWILVVNGSTATGSYAGNVESKSLLGTITGDKVGVAVPGDTAVEGETGAFGTISGNDLTGTIYENGSAAGTFEGSTGACAS